MTKDKQTLHKVADTILDKPITLTIDIKPQGQVHRIAQRLGISPKIETYNITGITLTNMIRVSDLLLDIDAAPISDNQALEWAYRAVSRETKRMAEIIAIAIHNKRTEPPEALSQMILNNFTAGELRAVTDIILDRLDMPSFINSIASVRTMNILEEASPQGPEIIAAPIAISGELSAELSNIFDTAKIM